MHVSPLLLPRLRLSTDRYVAEWKDSGPAEISEKTRQSVASSGTISTCINLGLTPSGIEPSLPRWEVSSVTTTPLWPAPAKDVLIPPRAVFAVSCVSRKLKKGVHPPPPAGPVWEAVRMRKETSKGRMHTCTADGIYQAIPHRKLTWRLAIAAHAYIVRAGQRSVGRYKIILVGGGKIAATTAVITGPIQFVTVAWYWGNMLIDAIHISALKGGRMMDEAERVGAQCPRLTTTHRQTTDLPDRTLSTYLFIQAGGHKLPRGITKSERQGRRYSGPATEEELKLTTTEPMNTSSKEKVESNLTCPHDRSFGCQTVEAPTEHRANIVDIEEWLSASSS
ncbi:hypothetical protein PR048_011495 [Dryococelus australis]|uniref:Uncharacterized protein n=1 Tax=Dryococelus australis TaxID=614101 RepID=A0ABQ9HLR1_9NEOP|nr:hypothetical protein PR048_011495 [Dryococelus australis]